MVRVSNDFLGLVKHMPLLLLQVRFSTNFILGHCSYSVRFAADVNIDVPLGPSSLRSESSSSLCECIRLTERPRVDGSRKNRSKMHQKLFFNLSRCPWQRESLNSVSHGLLPSTLNVCLHVRLKQAVCWSNGYILATHGYCLLDQLQVSFFTFRFSLDKFRSTRSANDSSENGNPVTLCISIRTF